MRILYCDRGESTGQDCRRNMLRLGHQVTAVRAVSENGAADGEFVQKIREELSRQPYDCLFSFGYLPLLSDIAWNNGLCPGKSPRQSPGLRYLSWVYDSPDFALLSKTVARPCNYIFVFDRCRYEEMRGRGIDRAFPLDLAVDAERLSGETAEWKGGYEHEISFVGSLYRNEYSFYEQIRYLPHTLKMYVEAVIDAQQFLYGHDLIGEETILSSSLLDRMLEHIRFDMGEDYEVREKDMLRDILRREAGARERERALEFLGKRHPPVDLYTRPGAAPIPGVRNLGYAEYQHQMPMIFCSSKINLNLTLRSIGTGIPLRALDIMGAGGFLLSNYQRELAEKFKDGEELVLFDSLEDLAGKADYYLAHDEERERIAENGRRAVRERFSYEKKLNELFSIVGADIKDGFLR